MKKLTFNLPSYTPANIACIAGNCFENSSDFRLGDSTGVKLSHFTNIIPCKFRMFARFSSTNLISSFLKHIFCVIFRSAEKKVIRIYAGSIIAFMKNKNTIWYNSVVEQPTKNMRPDILLNAFRKMAVALALFCSNPNPTFVSRNLFHLAPKSTRGGCGVAFWKIRMLCYFWTTHIQNVKTLYVLGQVYLLKGVN